jgi:hypothetical protein
MPAILSSRAVGFDPCVIPGAEIFVIADFIPAKLNMLLNLAIAGKNLFRHGPTVIKRATA